MYADGEYDLAGFCVGVVEREPQRRRHARSRAGDVLLGLRVVGASLERLLAGAARAARAHASCALDARRPGSTDAGRRRCSRPTRIYVRALRALHARACCAAAAHITGGGLVDNPPRMLPEGARLQLRIRPAAGRVPPIFELHPRGGDVEPAEMRRTFNMGIGMLVVRPPADRRAHERVAALLGRRRRARASIA